jgi:hypothetical protein
MGWPENSNCDVSELIAGQASLKYMPGRPEHGQASPQYMMGRPEHGQASPQYMTGWPEHGSAVASPLQSCPPPRRPASMRRSPPGAPQPCAPCFGHLTDLCGGWPQAGAHPRFIRARALPRRVSGKGLAVRR